MADKDGWDVFFSYSRQDAAAVDSVRAFLEARNIRVFQDSVALTAGTGWQQVLEYELLRVPSILVFVGARGLQGWHAKEMRLAIDRQAAEESVDRTLPVIPVLLPGSSPRTGFLFQNNWIDLRGGVGDPEAIDRLVAAIRGHIAHRQDVEPGGVSPYVSLGAFQEEDAAFFFGRTDVVRELLAQVGRERRPYPFVLVIGPSGCGKSSVVRAGLIPQLRQLRSPSWQAAVCVPGQHPWRQLADAIVPLIEPAATGVELSERAGRLADEFCRRGSSALVSTIELSLRAMGASRFLLVVDQLEELWTPQTSRVRKPRAPDAQDTNTLDAAPAADLERQSFLRALLEASANETITVVATLRADYCGRAIESDPLLADAMSHPIVVGAMSQQSLREVIVKPAESLGASVSAGLVNALLIDVGNEPGLLPLLEYALTGCWERAVGSYVARRGGSTTPLRLEFEDYEAAGRISHAIADRADTILHESTPARQLLVRQLFSMLVGVGASSAADTRRRALRSELDDDVWDVAQRFADERLLVIERTSDDTDTMIEVAHEAIIHHWKQLQSWIDEDREALRVTQQLKEATDAWSAAGRSSHLLLSGRDFQALARQAERVFDTLDPDIRKFVVKSAVSERYQIKDWVQLFAANNDALALAKEYLESHDPRNQIMALHIVRWIPCGASVDDADRLLAAIIARRDVEDRLFKCSVDASCERNQGRAIRVVLTHAHEDRFGVLRIGGIETTALPNMQRFRGECAAARARTNPLVGRQILDIIPVRRRGVLWLLTTYTLVRDHLQAFVLVIAFTSVLAQFGQFIAPHDISEYEPFKNVALRPFSVFKLATLSVLILFTALKANVDGRTLSDVRFAWTGILAAALADVRGVLPDELLKSAAQLLLTAPPIILLTLVMAGEAAKPFSVDWDIFNRTVGRDFGRLLKVTAGTIAVWLFVYLPLVVLSDRSDTSTFDWTVALVYVVLLVFNTIVATLGLLGFKVAITVAFEGRDAAAWLRPFTTVYWLDMAYADTARSAHDGA